MKTIACMALVGASLGVLLTADVARAQEEKTQLVQTSAFRVMLPDGWTAKAQRVNPKDDRLGTWVLSSGTRNSKIYVRVGTHNKGRIQDLWNRYVGQSLGKRAKHLRTQSYQEHKKGTTESAIGFLYGLSRRGKSGQLYKFGVIATRDKQHKRVLYAAVAGTEKGWPKQVARLRTLLSTLDLK
jgi:hypothetical protein